MAEGGGALRELLALFSLEVDDDGLKRAEGGLERFVGNVKKAGAVLADAFAFKVVGEFLRGQVEAAAHVQELSERLGIGAGDLSRFGKVAAGADVNLDQAANMLGHLNRAIGEASIGGGKAGENFAKLGVHLKDAHGQSRPFMEILADVSEGLSRMPDQAARTAYAMTIFGRHGLALLPILAKGKDSLAEELKEAKKLSSGLGEDYYESAKKAKVETARVSMALNSVKARIAAEVLPIILRLAIGAKSLAIRFLEFTKRTTVLKSAVAALGALMAFRFIGSLGTVLKILGILQPMLLATVAKLWAMAAPIIAVVALYLIFDDLFALMRGGQSVIGGLLDKLLGIGAGAELGIMLNAVIHDSIELVEELAMVVGDSLLLAFDAVKDSIVAVGRAMNDLVHGNFSKIGEDFSKGFGDLGDVSKKIGEHWSKAWAPGETRKAIDLQVAGVNVNDILAAQNMAGGLEANTPGARVTASSGRQPTSMTRRTAQAVTKIPMSSADNGVGSAPVVNQTNHYTTTVHTSSDSPHAIGQAVGAGVATTQEKANNNALRAIVRQ